MKSILASIAIASLCAGTAIAQPLRYQVIDLGTLPGGTSSMANYINENRVVAGNAADAHGIQQGIFWWGPLMIDIGTPGLNTGIFGVNPSGQASVSAEIPKQDPNNENFCAFGTGLECQAFLWWRGALIQLPTLGGNNATLGNINSTGEIAGAAENSTRDPDCPSTVSIAGTGPQVLDYEAVIWGPKPGDIRELLPLPGDTVGIALWINDKGQAVGATGTCANTVLPPLALGPHAVVWDVDGTAHDLGNLGSKVINMALSINNQGQVAGVSAVNDQATPAQGVHAFLWTSAAGMQDLGTLSGDLASAGVMINDAGDIVGQSTDAKGNFRAILWHDGVMNDLNSLVTGASPLFLVWATAINSRGEISGFGATEKGDLHAFLAIPTNDRKPGRPTDSEEPSRAKPALSEEGRKLLRQFGGRYVALR